MAQSFLRARRDGILEIARPSPVRWLLYALVAAFVVLPLVLSAVFELPTVLLAVPVMTVWVVVWVWFRRLDAPRRGAARARTSAQPTTRSRWPRSSGHFGVTR